MLITNEINWAYTFSQNQCVIMKNSSNPNVTTQNGKYKTHGIHGTPNEWIEWRNAWMNEWINEWHSWHLKSSKDLSQQMMSFAYLNHRISHFVSFTITFIHVQRATAFKSFSFLFIFFFAIKCVHVTKYTSGFYFYLFHYRKILAMEANGLMVRHISFYYISFHQFSFFYLWKHFMARVHIKKWLSNSLYLSRKKMKPVHSNNYGMGWNILCLYMNVTK